MNCLLQSSSSKNEEKKLTWAKVENKSYLSTQMVEEGQGIILYYPVVPLWTRNRPVCCSKIEVNE